MASVLVLLLAARPAAAFPTIVLPGPYLCYAAPLASGEPKFTPATKILTDEFETAASYSVVKPTLLCAPDPLAPAGLFEQTYQIKLPKGATAPAPGDQLVTDEFGTHKLKVAKADRLLVRATATDLGSSLTKCKDSSACSGGAQCIDKVCIDPGFPAAPPDTAPLDNFKCYGVSPAKGAPAFKKIVGGLVQATDPFGGTVSYDVLKPSHLCNPVDKNGENPGAETNAGRLVCYKVKPSKLSPPQPAFTPLLAAASNTNFPSSRVAVTSPKELCVAARSALAAVPPFGSLIYAGSESHDLATPGETDSFRLDLAASQTLTVVATPQTSSLTPSVEAITPGNVVIGSATAASPGLPVVLQTVPVSTSGAYTVAASGAAGSTGVYGLQSIVNAAFLQSSDSLDSFATAFDLSSAFATLGTTPSSDRAGIVGAHPTAPGTGQVASFSLAAGQATTIALRGTSSPAHVTLYNGVGTAVALGALVGGDIDEAIEGFVAPSSGTYYVVITGAASATYGLVVTRGADFGRHGTDFASAQRLEGTAVVLGGLPTSTQSGDWYQFEVNAGDNLVLTTTTPGGTSATGLEPVNGLAPTLNLYDAGGNLVAEATGNAGDGRNDVIDWTALSSGSYRAQVASAAPGGFGEYTLAVQGATGGAFPFMIASTTPAAGATLKRAPTSITVTLDHSVRVDSVSTSALAVDGQPATGFTIADDHTVVFAIAALAPGVHPVNISGLIDLSGLPLTPASFAFTTVK
jgi:hypothetical protein